MFDDADRERAAKEAHAAVAIPLAPARCVTSLAAVWQRRRRWFPLAPPLIFYLLAAIGLHFRDQPVEAAATAPTTVLGAVFLAILGTGVSTVMIYLLMAFSWSPERGFTNPFTATALLAFCGLPAVGVAVTTGWLPLVAVAVHAAIAHRKMRPWILVEYGCSALSLAWFMGAFERVSILPWGLPVALAQGAILLLFQPPEPSPDSAGSSGAEEP